MGKEIEIYIDYGATTPTDKRALAAALPYFTEKFANPSSRHFMGQEIKQALSDARKKIADSLNCQSEEIVFTGGGTEAENLAIRGIALSSGGFGKHVIVSSVEHNSVASSADFLKKRGFDIDKISVDKNCNVNIKRLEDSVRDDTVLVSIMMANNEVGTIQPIKEISQIIKNKNEERLSQGKKPIRFHTDAEAASFYLKCDVSDLGVDALTINGSKMYGMKGAAVLFVKKGTPLATQISGGGQENYLRGGTENIPAIIALAEAVSLADAERGENVKKMARLKKILVDGILKEIPSSRLNTPSNSLPHMAHVTFPNTPKNIVDELSSQGIAVSEGSACSANMDYKSHVLGAMNFSDEEINSSIRFSLGKDNTESDIATLIQSLKATFS